jgi:hypothetical protein
MTENVKGDFRARLGAFRCFRQQLHSGQMPGMMQAVNGSESLCSVRFSEKVSGYSLFSP